MNHCSRTYRSVLGPALLAGLCLGGLLSACGSETAAQPCEADLKAGELIITEIMSAPTGSDEGQEWIEIYNPTDRAVSLKGLGLAYADDREDSGNLYTFDLDGEIAPGAYYVVGSVEPEFQPEFIDHSYGKSLGRLGDNDGIIQVQCGTTVVDEVEYEHSGEGSSNLFDGALAPSAEDNDDNSNWCAASESYDGENNGSPGMANQPCMSSDPENTGRCRDGDTWREPKKPQVGDLIITEVMTDPTGDAKPEDAEWFEVYVANDVDLAGLQLGTTQGDEDVLTGANVRMTLDAEECQPVSAGSYIVFAGEVDPNLNGGLPQVDFKINFSLYNSDGAGVFVSTLAKTGGPDVIDAMSYPEVVDGAARSLRPEALDHQLNDDVDNWCFATESYGDGGNGSPGAANPECVDTKGLCLAGETPITLTPPAPGDIFITELMPDPSGSDADREWLELYVASDTHLGGVQVGKGDTVEQTLGDTGGQLFDCLAVSAGTHVLLASNANPADNGGLPEGVLPLDFSLANGGGEVFVGTPEGPLDTVSYPGATSGASLKLNPEAYPLGAEGNDNPMNWCVATAAETYGAGDFGTPGQMNGPCVDDPDPPMGECDDNGMMRLPVAPGPDDLRISEFMPDPSAVTDGAGEWFEVQVLGDFDLNNLELGKAADVKFTYEDPACRPVTAGTTLVFAVNGNELENGGLPPPDIVYSGLSLTNSGGDLFVGHGGQAIDTVMYNGSTAGTARSLDPNDNTTFCDAVDPYGDGDLGTPGTANPACPVQVGPGECLDGNIAREIVAPAIGDLVITEFIPNPDAVGDTAGEWIEVAALASFDLNGLQLGEQGQVEFTYEVTDCAPVNPGDHFLLARNGNPLENGGLPEVAIVYGSALSLTNSADDFFIAYNDEVLDSVAYTQSATGKSRSLDIMAYDPLQNDDEMNFCDGVMAYGDGDLGTPGQENPACM